MNSATLGIDLVRARYATIGLFFILGFALAVWVVSIPAVEARVGISHAALGGLLLVLGLGALIGMAAAGPLVDRTGSRPVAVTGALTLITGVCLLALVTGPWGLGSALLVFGLGHGALDVAMNDHAVMVQNAYGRPIMSSFHAFFSVAGSAGALAGAFVQTLGLGSSWTLWAGAAGCAVLLAIVFPALLRRQPVDRAARDRLTRAPLEPCGRSEPVSTIAILASLAFLMFLSEGVANDWSALHAVEDLGEPPAAAALAYGAYATAMTLGRFSADTIARWIGPVKVVRFGSLAGAAGMLAVVLSTGYPLTLAGWALFGFGIAGVIPQTFTAAGDLPGDNRGVVMSRVVGLGYLGLLAGPAVIGWTSQSFGLSIAFIIPTACCLTGVVLAGRVKAPAGQRQPSEAGRPTEAG